MGKFLILTGILITVLGLILSFSPGFKLPLLRGDIYIKKDDFSLYLPITSSILLSLMLSSFAKLFSK